MSSIPPPKELSVDMFVPPRLLYGPGPSNMTDVVSDALHKPLLGHLHPEFVKMMDDVREGVKYVFQTKSELTFAVSGTGHSGMECALLNLLERGEKLLVIEIGIWGKRAADLGRRMGLDVSVIQASEGQIVTSEQLEKALIEVKPKVVFVCQGESSTGVLQPLTNFGNLCHSNGTLLLVDTVASLGGAPFDMDALGVDCVYSATQKVLNAPPGLAPISFSPRAVEAIRARKTRVASFYFDALELGNYWGCYGEARRYHHTAPISIVYALRASLATIAKEGINECIARHKTNAAGIYAFLKENSLEPFVAEAEWRLPCLTTIRVPEGVHWKGVMDELLQNGIEIAGGLGPTVGKLWRIGTFGTNSNSDQIRKVLERFVEAIKNNSDKSSHI